MDPPEISDSDNSCSSKPVVPSPGEAPLKAPSHEMESPCISAPHGQLAPVKTVGEECGCEGRGVWGNLS